MKKICCLLLCVLLLLSGCTAGIKDNITDPTGTTAGETTVNTEASTNVADSDTTGSTQTDDEWEEVYEEFDGSGNSGDSQGGASSAGSSSSGSAGDVGAQGSGQITPSGSMEYYFMSGEGVLSPSNGDYFSKWGDSTLIVFPNGETMLIDAGVKSYYTSLKQRLHSLGVYVLDYLVFTHPHDDHCGGAWAGLFEDFEIEQVYHSGLKNSAWGKASAKTHIANICKSYGVPCTVLKMGDTLQIGTGSSLVTMRVLWPGDTYSVADGEMLKGSGKINNRSLVLRFDYGEHSSLFPGDIYKTYSHKGEMQVAGEVGADEAIVAYYTSGELDVDLLKLAHHGDASSSNSPEFFSATTPELAVATGFVPIETHWKLYQYADGTQFNPGNTYNNKVLFDRYNGYIHITATSGGKMTYETSRNGYLADFGATWNPVLDRKQ